MLSLRRYQLAVNPILVELFGLLARRGFEVEVGIGEDMVVPPDRIVPRHSLYILKSHAALWLSLAGVLHERGARLLNPYLASQAAQNKIIASQRLRAGGIPVPRSWVTGDLRLLPDVAGPGPFILKPYDGGRGLGIEIVQNQEALNTIRLSERPFLIQEYFPGNQEVLKMYVIGTEVFAFRKPSILRARRLPVRAVPLTDELRDIALRCGRLFGLRLYGLDLIDGPAGPLVVDLNYFPSYRGVAGAATLLADYIGEYARAGVSEQEPDILAGRCTPCDLDSCALSGQSLP
jgi:ribosomal protein S6--L-glutamate ligase